MAKHEFGIMPVAPQPGERYDQYGPWKYGCISVDDGCQLHLPIWASKADYQDNYDRHLPISHRQIRLTNMTSVEGKGLAYCDITLIPPSSLSALQFVYSEKNHAKVGITLPANGLTIAKFSVILSYVSIEFGFDPSTV